MLSLQPSWSNSIQTQGFQKKYPVSCYCAAPRYRTDRKKQPDSEGAAVQVEDTRERDLRQHALARRMMQANVRTSTVAEWTGLVAHSIRTLTKLHLPEQELRHRRNPPVATAYFGRSAELESEALAFIYIAMELK